ncbi:MULTISPECIES: cbb3-type cytochrome c oxidase subunit I [Leptospirillum]|jgi:cytochrome c oxidase cbb3-type subunit 1|uniref:Cytochrome oxidase n=2 Tax=Leptospirillum ferriphilum TaxID=178606 RepID=A0A059Y0G2_9BACT|nr:MULTISPECIES: cbb3-type cytochrome c oxidase subunit I [Leptospirillum]EAY56735.1 MAG: probable cytochrome C oxidase [Leptospirillum rubarum]EIJ76659.1 MAG: putative cytochrome C oxidase [Leptospirillum sp. Group II 'C75']MCL4405763.1 cbb3-type cytochrome c oxidase subunit I [Bacillota bacterium]MCL5259392.1 cbb3-type cytochrome c oxidase subunit I [Nitrospirota bacterium]AIA30947.1 cytochrome oxidase [Leptospirillum ferriphilum YSK]
MGREMAIKDYTMKFYYACLLYAIIGFSWGSIMGGVEQFRTFVQAGAGGPSDLIVLGHTHINLLGWVEMAIFGTIYYVVPRLYQCPLYSYRLMRIHFWTHNIGLVGMVLAFSIAGYKGGMILLHGNVANIKPVETPYMEMVGMFGMLVLFANFVFAYNIYNTVQVAKGKKQIPVSERENDKVPVFEAAM